MRNNRWLFSILSFALVFCMLCSLSMPVKADLFPEEYESINNPLRAGDGSFQLEIYSAKAGGAYTGEFLKKDNTLYMDVDTILNMGDIEARYSKGGDLLRILRKDTDAVYMVADYETYTFEDTIYYPFIDVVTNLYINVIYDKEQDYLRVFPAKNIDLLAEKMEEMSKKNSYRMEEWRTAYLYDAETSRYVAKATDIGRNLFSLPATIYGYASGDMDYEMFRKELWDIAMPNVEANLEEIDDFWEEKTFLDMLQSGGELAEKFPTSKEFFSFTNTEIQAMGKAAGIIADAGELLQYEDSMEVIRYYYSIDNINAAVANGLKLVNYAGTEVGTELDKALADVVAFNQGETSLSNMILQEMGDGATDLLLGEIGYGLNDTLGEFAVDLMDYAGEAIFGDGYVTNQLDAVLESTTNLLIQDAALKAYKYYAALYKGTFTYEDFQKKYLALQNMHDTMLIYMIAGHNAWKAMEFDKDLAVGSKKNVEELAEQITYLLGFGEEDFMVYQNAYNSKYAIMSTREGREQSIYMVKWDKTSADAIGGVEVSVMGKDKNGQPLRHKYALADVFYQENGMFVARINQASKNASTKTVTYYETDFPCELVIKPGNVGASVENIGLTIAFDFPGNNWDQDLSEFASKQKDGSTIYRIPLPLTGSTVLGNVIGQKDDKEIVDEEVEEEDFDIFAYYGYTPEGPFDGEYWAEFKNVDFKLRINTKTIQMVNLSSPYQSYIVYPQDVNEAYNEHVANIYFAGTTVEEQYQASIRSAAHSKSTVTATDMEEMNLGWGTLYRYEINVEGWRARTEYHFLIDYGYENIIVGYYDPEALTTKGDLDFIKMILELFGHTTIEKK